VLISVSLQENWVVSFYGVENVFNNAYRRNCFESLAQKLVYTSTSTGLLRFCSFIFLSWSRNSFSSCHLNKNKAMYVWRNTVALSRNHCYNGNTTIPSVCVGEQHINVKILSVAQQCFMVSLCRWKQQNLRRFSSKVPDAMNQRMFLCSCPSVRCYNLI
jgi:hypothetical protein